MLRFQLFRFDQIPHHVWEAWDAVQRANPIYHSPYFRPEWVQAMHHVGRKVELIVGEDQARVQLLLPFERSAWNVGCPVGGTLCDYHGPVVQPNLQFDWQELLLAAKLRGWEYTGYWPPEQCPIKLEFNQTLVLDLSQGYAHYCQARKSAGSETIGKVLRKARRAEREGGVRFEAQSKSPELLQQLVEWKRHQYARRGVSIDLNQQRIPELWQHLSANGSPEFSGQLSVLWIGNEPSALSYSMRSLKQAHVWFVGYAKSLAHYSPGIILLLKLAESFAGEGVQELHLGPGQERFKTSLATHSLALATGTVGVNRITTSWLETCKSAKLWLKQSPLRTAIRWLRPVRQWWSQGVR